MYLATSSAVKPTYYLHSFILDLHNFLFAVIPTPVKRHNNDFNVLYKHSAINVQTKEFSNPLAVCFAVQF